MRLSIVSAVAFALLAVPAAAEPGGKRKGEARESASTGDVVAGVLITAAERALMREYYVEHRQEFGGKHLPPGIAKNLKRGKPLPPGIAKKMPGGLAARMPNRPGYEYQVVGTDVLLVEVATGVIADLLRGVFR